MNAWDDLIKSFLYHLRIEKALSENSIDAYNRDIEKLHEFIDQKQAKISPQEITLLNLQAFIRYLNELGLHERSQARIVSGIKSFFKYLLLENEIQTDPSELLESPKIGRKLPDFLTIEEIDRILGAIDLSKPFGHRNHAIIETLYSCGLRVSELTNLRLSNLFFSQGFIKVVGKGNKERLVPISPRAMKEINNYLTSARNHQDIAPGNENFLFLNRRGKKLTRVMIFTIIKDLCEIAQIKKNVSPHTFRHSFATHLIDGGADLRAVQEMLGHESIITTEIYTHLDREYLRDTILRFHPRS